MKEIETRIAGLEPVKRLSVYDSLLGFPNERINEIIDKLNLLIEIERRKLTSFGTKD